MAGLSFGRGVQLLLNRPRTASAALQLRKIALPKTAGSELLKTGVSCLSTSCGNQAKAGPCGLCSSPMRTAGKCPKKDENKSKCKTEEPAAEQPNSAECCIPIRSFRPTDPNASRPPQPDHCPLNKLDHSWKSKTGKCPGPCGKGSSGNC